MGRVRFAWILPLAVTMAAPLPAADLTLSLRYQMESSAGGGRFHRMTRRGTWNSNETALIVCDVWDLHHSRNATRRVEELAPRLNALLTWARRQGMTIIHSPSDCMEAYANHPARRRSLAVPRAARIPEGIQFWCSRVPREKHAEYPLDQSDGGDDDEPAEHARWVTKLESMGRDPSLPWKTQSELITIDERLDYISDHGHEVWSILERNGVKNVMLTGVHVNMCVLGRPFGLRQMMRHGKNVLLVRDLTDSMYNPARWPYVDHFTGTDLIVSHIERYVCPTITSDQLLGGNEFRFQHDDRPHVVIVMAEAEYQTDSTLPRFAARYLGQHFRVSLVFGGDTDRNVIPGLDVLNSADIALISVRRRTPRPDQLAIVKKFVASGKPVVGIRTASHAFSLRGKPAPPGHADWPEFDGEVFGGSYTNHHGNKLASTVTVYPAAANHPILVGVTRKPLRQAGSLYKTAPLDSTATILMTGTVDGHPAEPVAWTFERRDGGRSFYTSMGHPDDFDNADFIQLLLNGIRWSARMPPAEPVAVASGRERFTKRWSLMPVPSSWDAATDGVLTDHEGAAWYRCAARIPEKWMAGERLLIELPSSSSEVWFNGRQLDRQRVDGQTNRYVVPREAIELNDANWLVARLDAGSGDRGWSIAPRLIFGARRFELAGNWQFRVGDDPAWANISLPARYGAPADIVFDP